MCLLIMVRCIVIANQAKTKMAFSKRRKVDIEGRIFQAKGTTSYFCTEMNEKPLCLICMQKVSVMKEYNVKQHYERHHEERYDKFQRQQRKDKINEILASLKKQQSAFTQSRDISDAAVKASHLIANKIALAS